MNKNLGLGRGALAPYLVERDQSNPMHFLEINPAEIPASTRRAVTRRLAAVADSFNMPAPEARYLRAVPKDGRRFTYRRYCEHADRCLEAGMDHPPMVFRNLPGPMYGIFTGGEPDVVYVVVGTEEDPAAPSIVEVATHEAIHHVQFHTGLEVDEGEAYDLMYSFPRQRRDLMQARRLAGTHVCWCLACTRAAWHCPIFMDG